MAERIDTLPKLLRIAARAGGIDAAMGLVRALGGKLVYIPEEAPANHPLTLAAGRKAADAIVEVFGGSNVTIPTGARRWGEAFVRRTIIAQALSEGASLNDAVGIARVHRRTVFRVKAQLRSGTSTLLMPKPAEPMAKSDTRQLDIEDWLKSQPR